MNKGPIILIAVGLTLTIVGELWGVFSKPQGDTITEIFFRSPFSLAAMGGLIVWACFHFFYARGEASWWDLIPLGAGIAGGILAWFFNRPSDEAIGKGRRDEEA